MLRSSAKRLKADAARLLQKLHNDKAVRFDFGNGQLFLSAQKSVIRKDAVMRQRKRLARLSGERMIIIIPVFRALRCHAGMSHHGSSLFRDAEPNPMRRERPFVDAQMAVHAIRDPGCVNPAHLAGGGQSRNHPVLLLCGQRSAVIIKSKQAAHYSSTSLSTGSLRYSRRSFRYWISSGSVIPAVKSDHDMAWSSESVR